MSRPNPVAIDTNILGVLWAYQATKMENVRGSRRLDILCNSWGRSRLDEGAFDGLWRQFWSAPKRAITPLVVAETFARRRRIDLSNSVLTAAAMELSTKGQFEELTCDLSALYGDAVYREITDAIGPTDAGQHWTILSGDRGLREWAAKQHVPVFSIGESDLR